MPGSFLDTNVLVYLASGNAGKAASAEKLVAGGGTVSIQVLNEFATVARRKIHLSWPETNSFLNTLRGLLTVAPLTLETHEAGLRIAQRYGLSVYDAMIAASALLSECTTLWTEDLQHGLLMERRLLVRNPFRALA